MDKVFLTVLNMSITGAFVIAAVILARLPLKKAPKIISYCLWAVVGFRLICPFSFEGVFSLIPWGAQPIPETQLLNESVSFGSAASAAYHAIGDAANGGLGTVTVYLGSTADGYPITTQAYHSQVWLLFLPYIWVAGIAVMLLYGIVSYLLLKRRMRTAIRVDGNIYETDNIPSPFVLGIIKPKIYLPLSLADGEREYILLHERTHIRRGDHIIKFFAYFILCLHWFNPLAWAAFLLMGVDMEMSCDERVLKELGGDTKHDYSRLLLSLATQRRVIGGSPLAFGEGGVKGRIKNVLNFRKPSRVIIALAVALVAVLSVGFATNAQRNAEVRTLTIADFEKIEVGANHTEVRSILGQPIGLLSGFWGDIYESDDGTKATIYYDDFGNVERINFENPDPITELVNTVSIIVWKDDNGQMRFSLYDGDVTPAQTELSVGRVFNNIVDLNAALAEYPKDTLGFAYIKQTMDFTKEEGAAITEAIKLPSGNYSKATGYYELDIMPDLETTPPGDPGYFTDPVEVVKAELEVDGCVILNVFAVDWATRQYALDGRIYDFVSIYAEYLEGPYGDAIYMMNYTMRRPSDDSTAQWKHDEPVFWEGIHYGVAKYAAEQYYAETGREAKISDMRPTSVDYSAYIPQDKQHWQAVAFNVEYEDDPKSHPLRVAVLISQDGVSRWQIVYWSGITTEE